MHSLFALLTPYPVNLQHHEKHCSHCSHERGRWALVVGGTKAVHVWHWCCSDSTGTSFVGLSAGWHMCVCADPAWSQFDRIWVWSYHFILNMGLYCRYYSYLHANRSILTQPTGKNIFTCGNSPKVAQFCRKTLDLATWSTLIVKFCVCRDIKFRMWSK